MFYIIHIKIKYFYYLNNSEEKGVRGERVREGIFRIFIICDQTIEHLERRRL